MEKLKFNTMGKMGKAKKIFAGLLLGGMLNCATLSANNLPKKSSNINNGKQTVQTQPSQEEIRNKTIVENKKLMDEYSSKESYQSFTNMYNSPLLRNTTITDSVEDVAKEYYENFYEPTVALNVKDANILKKLEEYNVAISGMDPVEINQIATESSDPSKREKIPSDKMIQVVRASTPYIMDTVLMTQSAILTGATKIEVQKNVQLNSADNNAINTWYEILEIKTNGKRNVINENFYLQQAWIDEIVAASVSEFEYLGEDYVTKEHKLRTLFKQLNTEISKKANVQIINDLVEQIAVMLPEPEFGGNLEMRRAMVLNVVKSIITHHTLINLAGQNYNVDQLLEIYAGIPKEKKANNKNVDFSFSAFPTFTNQHVGANLDLGALIKLGNNWDLNLNLGLNPYKGVNGGKDSFEILGEIGAGKTTKKDDRLYLGIKGGASINENTTPLFGVVGTFQWLVKEGFSVVCGAEGIFDVKNKRADANLILGLKFYKDHGCYSFGIKGGYTHDWNKVTKDNNPEKKSEPTITTPPTYGEDDLIEPKSHEDGGDINDLPLLDNTPDDLSRY